MFTISNFRPRLVATSLMAAAVLAGSLVAACSSGASAEAPASTPVSQSTAVAAASPSASHHAASPADPYASASAPAATDASATNERALYSAMRTLWAQHMEWTYSTVVAFATNEPALQPTVTRLLQNQKDIGAAVVPYYGQAAGDQLAALLSAHIEDAVPVLTAAKAGDKPALDTALTQWYANAQQIADFLASANPDWDQTDMREMMKTHITQTTAYASDILNGDWTAAIAAFDEAEAHMTEMADMLSQGIIAQFPDKF